MDFLDYNHLSRVEEHLVARFPGFGSFDSFGYGPFLHFLTNRKGLHETLQQLGSGTSSGHRGIRTGCVVSQSHVLDFIVQCGIQTDRVCFVLLSNNRLRGVSSSSSSIISAYIMNIHTHKHKYTHVHVHTYTYNTHGRVNEHKHTRVQIQTQTQTHVHT